MNPMTFVRSALLTASFVALSGCVSMAPKYTRPAAPVASHFENASLAGATTAAANDLDWRKVFVDPRLQQVIAQALQNNRDLRVAVLNIEKARAQYRIQGTELLPSVAVNAAQTAGRTAAVAGSGVPAVTQRAVSTEVGFSSWELDLFGRIRSLKTEALETYLATEQAQRSARMSLVAEVAGDWLAVGVGEQRLALAQQTLASQRESLRLSERKHDLGASSGLDLAQMRSTVERARADVAGYKTALAQARNALELVVGSPVNADLLPMQPDHAGGDVAVALAPMPASLSSAVLLQRPDVLAAEHTLKAANADIGAARAAFFPTISLTASTGRSSDALSDLFDGGSRTWSFIPRITLPIFNGGALKASLDASEIQKQIEIAEYEKTIQTAFSEVADALAARANVDEQLDAQGKLVDATQRSFDLASARFKNGVDSYLEVLDSQRSLYDAQQSLITLRLDEAVNRVTLYKVLGGGADARAVADQQRQPAVD